MIALLNPIRDVAAAIILQAVNDWEELINGKEAEAYCNFKEIRSFFKSDWAVLLASELGLSATDLLQHLENERKERDKKKND